MSNHPSPSHRILAELTSRLRSSGSVFAEEEAELLVAAASTPAALERLTARRIAGEPLEYVLGWVEFGGLRLSIAPGAFIPRRRTEHLAREAAALAEPEHVVVDLCCGVGAIGAVVRSLVPGVELYAADIDPVAVACARQNLGHQGVSQGDLFAALPPSLRGRIRVIVANVPYVPTEAIAYMPREAREHEPVGTLDGGADGLDIMRRVAAQAGDWLAPGGSVLFEVADEQVDAATAVLVGAELQTRFSTSEEFFATAIIGTRQ